MLNNTLLAYTSFTKTLTFPILKFMAKPIDLKTLIQDLKIKKIVGPKSNPIIHSLSYTVILYNPIACFLPFREQNITVMIS